MKYYTVRIIDGTNTYLLNEMIERDFYLPKDCFDAHQAGPQFKTTIYDSGFDIRFSIPDRYNEIVFADWVDEVVAKMFDDIGYDWWDGDEDRIISIDKFENMMLVRSSQSA